MAASRVLRWSRAGMSLCYSTRSCSSNYACGTASHHMQLGYLKRFSLPRFDHSVPYVTFLGNPNFKLEVGSSLISVSALPCACGTGNCGTCVCSSKCIEDFEFCGKWAKK